MFISLWASGRELGSVYITQEMGHVTVGSRISASLHFKDVM
jgi:hypothetical protein